MSYRVNMALIVIISFFFLTTKASNSQEKPAEVPPNQAVKLPPPINTANYSEFSPTISPDGTMLIFESDRDTAEEWKLYISRKTDSSWTDPVALDSVNSTAWDGAPFITYDQNFLYFSSKRPGGYGDVDIWYSERVGDKWRKPVNIGPPVNSANYDGFASVSRDNQTIYFMRCDSALLAATGEYNFDIYASHKDKGEWGIPEKLPAPILSEASDAMPLILADNKTLIFSSNRQHPDQIGGYDLYAAPKLTDSTWSAPINLGKSINTKLNEDIASIQASDTIMYYTSGLYGKTDIYTAPLPDTLSHHIEQTKVCTGTVVNRDTGEPICADITVTDISNPADLYTIRSNSDGRYVIIVPEDQKTDIAFEKDNYLFDTVKTSGKKSNPSDQIRRDITLTPLQVGEKRVLKNLFFLIDSDSLLDESILELNRLIKIMAEDTSICMEIAGHTDNTGSDIYNLNLSEKRAQKVVNYLFTSGGITKKRLRAKGYGASTPIADNGTEKGRQQNRRVEFEILKKDD